MTRLSGWIGLGGLVLAGCADNGITPPPPGPPPLEIDTQLRQGLAARGVIPIGPMPAQDPARVELGRALFFDPILSGNRDIACASCHTAAVSLGDGLSLAVGTGGTGHGPGRTLGPGRQFVPRNAPTLLNAGLGAYLMFWDASLTGREPGTFSVKDEFPFPPGLPNLLSAQAMLPVLNRREMRGDPGDRDVFGNRNELADLPDADLASIWQGIIDRLLAVQEYQAMFQAAFPDLGGRKPTFVDAARALATFQMEKFITTRSPFDRYLDGDFAALTPEQKRGGLLFVGKAKCAFCHNGPFLGAQGFANVGAPQIGPGGTREPPLDLGKGETVGFESYRFAFRVAPLRNVELTAPYMHSGAYATLEAVVNHYNDVPQALARYDVSQLAPAYRGQVHLDAATVDEVLSTLTGFLQGGLDLTETEIDELVAFLESLTDPAARNLAGVVPARVPSGLPVAR